MTIPHLHPKPPGRIIRTAGLVLPGIRRVADQIEPYTRWWSEQNQAAVEGDGPLLAVIGDSTALGIGASAPHLGYVGLVAESLARRDGRPWRVVNLAQSGARAADGVERQLPVVEHLAESRVGLTLTICCIGTNDVVWSADTGTLRDRLRHLVRGLPGTGLAGLVAGSSARARLANRALRQAAEEAGVGVVDPWREPGPGPGERLAEDRFHPSDLGYALMARPFARHLGAPEPATVG